MKTKSPPWPSAHLLLLLFFLCLPGTFLKPVRAVASLKVGDFFNSLNEAMDNARRYMAANSIPNPSAFNNGGACVVGFGINLNVQDCRAALRQIPSDNLDPNDVQDAATGQWITRIFDHDNPRLWKMNTCMIGVSVYDAPGARGLYPAFKTAAGSIIDRCVARSTGGVLRFAHFEVVIFDESLLPRNSPDFIYNWMNNPGNIPFSAGLEQLWRARSQPPSPAAGTPRSARSVQIGSPGGRARNGTAELPDFRPVTDFSPAPDFRPLDAAGPSDDRYVASGSSPRNQSGIRSSGRRPGYPPVLIPDFRPIPDIPPIPGFQPIPDFRPLGGDSSDSRDMESSSPSRD